MRWATTSRGNAAGGSKHGASSGSRHRRCACRFMGRRPLQRVRRRDELRARCAEPVKGDEVDDPGSLRDGGLATSTPTLYIMPACPRSAPVVTP